MITDIVIVVAAALLAGVYVSWRAGRIDRLHARVEMARTALDVTLLRRSSVALELATSGLLDPATSLLLASAVHGTRPGQDNDRPRDLAESDLTRALRAAFSQRRKSLANALAAGLAVSAESARRQAEAAGIDPGRRAETLSLAEFARLAAQIAEPGPA